MPSPKQLTQRLFPPPSQTGHRHGRSTSGSRNGDHVSTLSPAGRQESSKSVLSPLQELHTTCSCTTIAFRRTPTRILQAWPPGEGCKARCPPLQTPHRTCPFPSQAVQSTADFSCVSEHTSSQPPHHPAPTRHLLRISPALPPHACMSTCRGRATRAGTEIATSTHALPPVDGSAGHHYGICQQDSAARQRRQCACRAAECLQQRALHSSAVPARETYIQLHSALPKLAYRLQCGPVVAPRRWTTSSNACKRRGS